LSLEDAEILSAFYGEVANEPLEMDVEEDGCSDILSHVKAGEKKWQCFYWETGESEVFETHGDAFVTYNKRKYGAIDAVLWAVDEEQAIKRFNAIVQRYYPTLQS
jgi:hypothetical protein